MKSWIPYPSKHGDPIRQNTEDNITSINNKEEEEGKKQINDYKSIINFYETNITLITEFVAEDIRKYLEDGLTSELIIEAMKEAVSRNKRNWKYITGILNNCIDNKIRTADQFRISQEEFKSNKNKSHQKKTTEEKIEYEEVQFASEEEYRKKLYEKQKG